MLGSMEYGAWVGSGFRTRVKVSVSILDFRVSVNILGFTNLHMSKNGQAKSRSKAYHFTFHSPVNHYLVLETP